MIKERVTWIGITFILLGIIGFLLTIIVQDPIVKTFISNLAAVCLGVGLVELVIQFFFIKHFVRDVSSQVAHTLNLPLEKFYENRDDLPPLDEELKDVSEVWFAWHTGSVKKAEGINDIIKKIPKICILLAHPDSKSLDELAKICGLGKDTLKEDIKALTKLVAQKSNIEIKWTKELIGNSVIIANPNDTEKSWVRVELIVPHVDTKERPSFRVSKNKGGKTFQIILQGYKDIWNNHSETPSDIFFSKK